VTILARNPELLPQLVEIDFDGLVFHLAVELFEHRNADSFVAESSRLYLLMRQIPRQAIRDFLGGLSVDQETALLRRRSNQPWTLFMAGVKVAALPRKPSGRA